MSLDSKFIFYLFLVFLFIYTIIPRKEGRRVLFIFNFIFLAIIDPTLMFEFITISVFNFFWLKFARFKWSSGLLIALNVGTFFYLRSIASINEGGIALPAAFFLLSTINLILDVSDDAKFFESLTVADFFSYLLFFPKVLAGPLIRPHEFYKQIKSEEPLSKLSGILPGLNLMLIGLIKKNVLSDRVADFILPFYKNPVQYSGEPLYVLVSVFFSFIYIYLNLSAYTYMARGAGLCFQVILPENFNLPFLAKSPSEFWSKTHMTISSWFRDFVFFPLAVLTQSQLLRVFSLLFTFTICGLWHNQSLNFAFWGLLNGLGVVLTHPFEKTFRNMRKGSKAFAVVVNFIFIAITTAIALSPSLEKSREMLTALAKAISAFSPQIQNHGLSIQDFMIFLSVMAGVTFIECKKSVSQLLFEISKSKREQVIKLAILVLFILLWYFASYRVRGLFTYLNL